MGCGDEKYSHRFEESVDLQLSMPFAMLDSHDISTDNPFKLVSAAGQFSVPKKASIDGLDIFKGSEWHTVNWPQDYKSKIAGKRVGIIGTGPSAAQLLGHISKDFGSLKIYQRSPSYCLPRQDFVAGPVRKWLFSHFPFVMSIYKFYLTKMVSDQC